MYSHVQSTTVLPFSGPVLPFSGNVISGLSLISVPELFVGRVSVVSKITYYLT